MRQTIKYLMVAFVAVIAIAGCKKEINWNAFPDPNGNGCKLSTLKADFDGFGNYTINFQYDAQGRISKATAGAETNTYTYSANKITAKDQDGYVAEINLENGRAASSGSDGVIKVGNVVYEYTRKYTYNAEGYLIQVKNYLNGELYSIDNLSYANGNLVKAVLVMETSGHTTTTDYSYSTGNVAVNVYEISDPLSYHVDYFPGGYFGKQSKNVLLKSSSVTADQNGDPFSEEVITFNSQYDAKGNATSVKMDAVSTFYTVVNTFTARYDLSYTCK
ncbi:hypothetical protein [Pedobacter sp.]|uniref:hypothetical protein n=1 Tax=Pedobacter sp. TaxID=1411316 RepID=UPI003BAA0AFE